MQIVKWTRDDENIVNFYKKVDYTYNPKEGETVFAAVDDNEEILGVVRLSEEDGLLHLRGMQIKEEERSKGIGTKMLLFLDKQIGDRLCYLVGYPHLTGFYGQIGFHEISPDDTPKQVRDRYENARERFPATSFNIMVRGNKSS
jgi:N-acetylglutamate synthase-like GNAT family acetyltransferase